MRNKNNYDEQLARIMNGLADSVLDLSDSELLAELQEEGVDPQVEAERTKNVLRAASKAYRKRKLEEAQRTYEKRVAEMRAKSYELPSSPSKQRELLAAVIAVRPDLQSALFTAHRDFRELSDADVESFLKQLKELGVLDTLKLPEL